MLTKDSPGAARLLDLMMLRNNKRSIVSGPVLTPLTSATLNNWMAHSCNFQDQNIIRIQKVLKVALQEIFHQIIRAIDRVIMYRQRAQRDSLLCGFLYDFVNQIFELPFLIAFLFRPQPLTWSMNFEGYRSLRGNNYVILKWWRTDIRLHIELHWCWVGLLVIIKEFKARNKWSRLKWKFFSKLIEFVVKDSTFNETFLMISYLWRNNFKQLRIILTKTVQLFMIE